jgi:heptosyltransferase-2
MPYRNILVRATNWVGDAVMSLPALQHLRASHPQARISILAKPWVSALYAREPFCDEIIHYEGLRAATRLRSRRFDCAILLQNAFEAAAAAWLARIPVRIGYNRDARGWLLTQSIPVPTPNEIPKHQRFYYLELLKRARLIEAYDSNAPIHLTTPRSPKNIIGVSPGAAYGGAKRWLPERFAESAIQIAHASHCSVVIMGSQSEHEICEQVRTQISNAGIKATNLAGKTTLTEFIDTAAACRLILTNDSGSMHIGSALGVPTVTIFGPTDEFATGPTGSCARIIRHPVECSPCLLRECPIDHRCMTRVPSAQVTQVALELLHG